MSTEKLNLCICEVSAILLPSIDRVFAECISPILTLYSVYIVYTVYNQSGRGVDAENPTFSGFLATVDAPMNAPKTPKSMIYKAF
ncbi:hypothetical protein [Nostoc sp.]|uniref:hypothetical protein n=1 Tax=Nostoc sp. TaxID=1180 RepID=UPI002D793675|nr:hypothetical protein [Nostoc sp.]